MSRRGFLKLAAAASVPAILGSLLTKPSKARAEENELKACTDLNEKRGSYWKEGGKYFVQSTVDTSLLDQGFIKARVDGQWKIFRIRNVPAEFLNYNMDQRLQLIQAMMGMGGDNFMIYDPHNAAVASYGANRGDSRVTLNCAYKGMGWIPKPEYIDEMIQEYYDNYKASMSKKLMIIVNNYHAREKWRRDIIGSLELYTTQDYETHTFLNVMENPVVTICFTGTQSYEIRAICRLLHPDNPNLSEEDKKIATWINYAHDFFHGGPPDELKVYRIAAVYHVIEVFDNSPWGATPTAGGHRLVPEL